MASNLHLVKTSIGDVPLYWQSGERRLYSMSLPNHAPDPRDPAAPDLVDRPPDWVRRIADAVVDHLSGGAIRYRLDWLDLSRLTVFRRRVSERVFEIPAGEVRTYGEVACAAGSPGASRAVGSTMANNPFPLIIPCHRVVSSTGLGGFGGGLEQKKLLLAIEARTAQP